jgi:hypothetical protein
MLLTGMWGRLGVSIAVAVAALLGACGRIDFDPYSRLHPVSWRTADEIEVFDHWYDTKLDLDCAFSVSGPSPLHCFPRDAVVQGRHAARGRVPIGGRGW